MIDRSLRSVLSLLLLLSLALPFGATAQDAETEGDDQQSEQPDELFIDTVEVNVVNVDVYVTDDEGQPVTGLTADDFEILENGRPMEVSNFYAFESSQVVEQSGSAAAESGGEGAIEAVPVGVETEKVPGVEVERQIPEDQRLSLVIYIDNYNIRPHNRRRILQDVRAFVSKHVGPEDRVMLVSYDRSLHVRQTFTTNARAVIDELFKLDEVSGHAVHFDSDRRDILERIDETNHAGTALMWAETYADSLKNDLFFSIDAMREVINSLAGLPGRKAVLYVSDGLPMIAAEDIFHVINNKFTGSGAMTQITEYDASRRFQELAALANANRVSYYTIDAAGLRTSSAADVSTFGRGSAGSMHFVDSIRTHNLQAPLQLLAEQTGGRAIINTNRVLPDLDRVAQDFRTFYSLGYTPGHSGTGRYYEIKVRLRGEAARRDYSIRHRAGYRDKTSAAQMSDGVLAALNFPYYANPLGLDVSFGQGRQREDGHYVVPVRVSVPIRSLTLIPRGEVYEARARLYLAAKDERGGVSEVQKTMLPVQLGKDEVGDLSGKAFTYTVTLLMRSGEQKVAVGIRDEIAANNSFVTGSIYLN